MATKINVRSPFYVQVSNASIASATLDLFIYTGAFTTDKGTAKYQITKEILSGEDFINFEIAELVRDYIEITFDGTYDSQTVWVEADIVTTILGTATGTDSDKLIDSTASFTSTVSVGDIAVDSQGNIGSVISVDSDIQLTLDNTIFTTGEAYQIKQELNIDYIAFDGYGYFYEGINPELNRTYLQSNTTIFKLDDTSLRIPVFSEDTTRVTFQYKNGTEHTQSISSSTNTNAQIIYASPNADVESYEERVINDGGTLETSPCLDSALDGIDVFPVDKVLIESANGIEVIDVVTYDECYYEPVKVTFVNKFGALQDLYFFKKSVETLTAKKESFQTSLVDRDNLTYNTSRHSMQSFHVQGKISRTLNTGYVDDGYAEVMDQLLLSEQTWLTDYINGDEIIRPISVKTSSVTHLNGTNDKLMNYTISIDMANNRINDIR